MSIDLSEYKANLAAQPDAVNGSQWYARGAVHHNGRQYPAGSALPLDLTNQQVLDLMAVNAITSVNPKPEVAPAPAAPAAPASTPVNTDENGNPIGEDLTAEQQAARQAELERLQANGELGPDGNARVDENGNPVQ
jgi:hypothetical protein